MKTKILTGDVCQVLQRQPANSFDACFCDPPYGLEFMGVAWDSFDRPKGKARTRNTWGDFGSREHAHSADDAPRVQRNKNIAFQEFNAAWLVEVLRVLKPGAPLLAFGGTRTFHRLACAIEDGGFILSDTLCWLHGQGFPKGHAQLKPAWEPITLAWKKGPRVLAIDAGRIGAEAIKTCGGQKFPKLYGTFGAAQESTHLGRWPANVLLDEEAAAALDAQSGKSKSIARTGKRTERNDGLKFAMAAQVDVDMGHTDTGGASRFFYCAKASRSERGEGNTHPTVKPIKLAEYLARLILPPERDTPRRLLVPFSGSGSEIIGARKAGWDEVTGIELNADYVGIATARMKAAA